MSLPTLFIPADVVVIKMIHPAASAAAETVADPG
jgi:hypothetical protein